MIATLYQASGTSKAGLFMLAPRSEAIPTASRQWGVWIPKSCYLVHSREPDKVWQWPACTVEVKDWWARKANLAARIREAQEHSATASHHETP